MALQQRVSQPEATFGQRLIDLNWGLVVLVSCIAGIGIAMLYSVADGNVDPWARRQAMRFGVGLGLMLVVAMTDIRLWMRLAYPLYGAVFLLLIGVEVVGTTGKGAERWINLGFFQLQPSELMKITVILALARWFHSVPFDRVSSPQYLIVPFALIGAPMLLVLKQPDLGTALLIGAGGFAMLFMAGVSWKFFAAVIAAVAAAVPLAYNYLLHDYQRRRIDIFLNPETDPKGAGYHIMQSKIAFGSGGMSGRGYMEGTQAHLNFLPEKHTDFIFAMYAEEFGLIGALFLLALYLAVLVYLMVLSLQVRNQFGRLVVMGVTVTIFLFVFINVGMVTGLLPVVGVPLPLVSYGGTSMLTLTWALGLALCAHSHRKVDIPRYLSHV